MPRYDYKCDKCASTIEVERGFGEDREPACTGCNSTMSRVWVATPAIFKGGGWGAQ